MKMLHVTFPFKVVQNPIFSMLTNLVGFFGFIKCKEWKEGKECAMTTQILNFEKFTVVPLQGTLAHKGNGDITENLSLWDSSSDKLSPGYRL